MVPYIGDYFRGDTVIFYWNSFNSSGASITRATNGTISVYEQGGTTQFTTGVTDTEDFDSLTGVHKVEVDTSDSQYERGKDYAVVLSGATIDGQTVNGVLFTFSLENRTVSKDQVIYQGTVSAADASTLTLNGSIAGSSIDNIYDGCIIYVVSGTGAGQSPRFASTQVGYDGTLKILTLASPFTTTLSTDSEIRIIRSNIATVNFPANFEDLAIDGTDGYVDANITHLNDNTGPIGNFEDDYDGTGYNKANSSIGNVVLADGSITAAKFGANAITSTVIASNALTSAKFADNFLTAAKLAADAVAEIQSGLSTLTASDVWARVLGSTTMSASALLQICAGVSAGKLSGAATTTVTIRNIQDSQNMIVATVDENGNRSAIAITTPSN